jgi:hypothetical protein
MSNPKIKHKGKRHKMHESNAQTHTLAPNKFVERIKRTGQVAALVSMHFFEACQTAGTADQRVHDIQFSFSLFFRVNFRFVFISLITQFFRVCAVFCCKF